MRVTCYFCGDHAPTTEEAIDAGWIPSFYFRDSNEESLAPVCFECQEDHLMVDTDGEMVEKPLPSPAGWDAIGSDV